MADTAMDANRQASPNSLPSTDDGRSDDSISIIANNNEEFKQESTQTMYINKAGGLSAANSNLWHTSETSPDFTNNIAQKEDKFKAEYTQV